MEKTYRCVSGEIVALNDTVEYIYKREDIEPLFRDVFTLCYPKYPVMVNGMMFDGNCISKWHENNSYRDPITRKRFSIEDINYIYALKFILLCLEDTFDDTKILYKTVIDETGASKQVYDHDATNDLYMKAVVKFHAPPSNILHACKLAECLIGENTALIDGKPAPWIINKRVNENVEYGHPDRIELDGPIRTSAYALNRSAIDVYPIIKNIVGLGCGGYGGFEFNSVSFSELPQGFRLVGCKLINCSQFDHLELIDSQVICDYKCYPLPYYITVGLNSGVDMRPCDTLVYGHNYTLENPNESSSEIINRFKAQSYGGVSIANAQPVVPIPPIYESLRSVKHVATVNSPNDLPATPISNYDIPLQVGKWLNPLLAGMLTPEQMMDPNLKFDRCFNIMSLINTNSKFKRGIAEFNNWMGHLPTSAHNTVFTEGCYEPVIRRRDLPKMVDSDTWYDLSGLNMNGWKLRNCNFKDTTFAAADLSGALFENCTFNNVDFTTANLANAKFVECKFVKIQPAHAVDYAGIKYVKCIDVENIIEHIPGIVVKPIDPKLPVPETRIETTHPWDHVDSDDSDSD